MPPKRKAAGAGAKGGKKAKTEAPATPKTMKDAAAALKAEDKKSGGKKSHKIDSCCTLGSGEVCYVSCFNPYIYINTLLVATVFMHSISQVVFFPEFWEHDLYPWNLEFQQCFVKNWEKMDDLNFAVIK
jgi:hypothetical protein